MIDRISENIMNKLNQDKFYRESNFGRIVEMKMQIKDNLIENIKRERIKNDWLSKINISVHNIIKENIFEGCSLWSFIN